MRKKRILVVFSLLLTMTGLTNIVQASNEETFNGRSQLAFGVLSSNRFQSQPLATARAQLAARIIETINSTRRGQLTTGFNQINSIAVVSNPSVQSIDQISLDLNLLQSGLDSFFPGINIGDIQLVSGTALGNSLADQRFQAYLQSKLRLAAINEINRQALGELAIIDDFVDSGFSSQLIGVNNSLISQYTSEADQALLNAGEQDLLDLFNASLRSNSLNLAENVQEVGFDGFFALTAVTGRSELAALGRNILSLPSTFASTINPRGSDFERFPELLERSESIYRQIRVMTQNDDITLESLNDLIQTLEDFALLVNEWSDFLSKGTPNPVITNTVASIAAAINELDKILTYQRILVDHGVRLSQLDKELILLLQIEAASEVIFRTLEGLSNFTPGVATIVDGGRGFVTAIKLAREGMITVQASLRGDVSGPSFVSIERNQDFVRQVAITSYYNSTYYLQLLDEIGNTIANDPVSSGLISFNNLSAVSTSITADVIGIVAGITGDTIMPPPAENPVPSQIANITASSGFINSIEINWDIAQGSDAYEVFQCESITCQSPVLIGTALTNQFIREPVTVFGESFYRVRGCNDSELCGVLSAVATGSIAVPQDRARLISFAIPDFSLFQPGDRFRERWVFENTGSFTWNSSYCMRHFSGISLGVLEQECVSGTVAPGDTYTFTPEFETPQGIPEEQEILDNWNIFKGDSRVAGGFGRILIKVPAVSLRADTPNSFQVATLNATEINLSWSSSDSGGDYRIFRSLSPDDGFVLLRQLSSLAFVDDGLEPETTYYYRLQRCVDGNDTCSDLTATRSATTPVGANRSSLIQSNTISSSNLVFGSSVLLNTRIFNGGGVATNDRFNFFYAISDDAAFDQDDSIIFIAAETNSSFPINIGNSEAISFNFRVPDDAITGDAVILACVSFRDLSGDAQAVCENHNVTFIAEPLLIPNVPNRPSIAYQQGQSQAGISWNNSSGGQFYRLARSLTSSTGFSEVYSGEDFSFLDTNIGDDVTYFYRLRSCQNSLLSTCSSASTNASLSTLATANNDFIAQNIEISRSGNQITVEAGQAYVGTSVSLVRPNIGFFLSQGDSQCTVSDLFLGSQTSGLSASDTVDVERVTATYPDIANSGVWYACAIADYDNQFNESNESNNSVSTVARNDVSAPTLDALTTNSGGQIRATWQSVPSNVSYRLNRSLSPDGPFTVVYIGTSTSHLDTSLSSCTQYHYRLDSCNSTSGNATCSESPVVSTSSLPNVSPEPSITILGENKAEISWEDNACASYYVLDREDSRFDRRVYNGSDTNYIDINLAPNTSYSYTLRHCRSEEGFFNNGCASASAPVTVTTPNSPLVDNNWVEEAPITEFSGRSGVMPIVFKNKLWVVGGRRDGESLNDVWSSDDGVNWTQVIANASFSPRDRAIFAVHNQRLYLLGGRLADGSLSNELWSTNDGESWILENSSLPFPVRGSNAKLVSFSGKLLLIGGSMRSEADGSFLGDLSDIWSSEDGVQWTQVTANAPFGVQGNHQVLEINGRLYVYAGRAVSQSSSGFQTQVFHDAIWSSVDGTNWVVEKEGLPYGPRDQHSVVEFAGQYWLIGGRERVQREAQRDNLNQKLNPILEYIQTDDVWVSRDGLSWSVVDKATIVPAALARNAINFNNSLWIIPSVGSTRWRTNYGFVPNFPSGELGLRGIPTAGATVEADLTDINFTLDQGLLTYHWFRNGVKLLNENNPSLILDDFLTGDNLALKVRYSSEDLEMFEFEIANVIIVANPIDINFVVNQINTVVSMTGLNNELIGFEPSYEAVYTSSNEGVVQVAGSGSIVEIDALAVGTSIVSVDVTDTVTGARRSLSFRVVVDRNSQALSFGFGQIALPLESPSVSLTLTESGQGSGVISYSSSNSGIAQVVDTDRDSVTLLLRAAGEVTITAAKAADANFLAGSRSIILTVFIGDSDGDGVLDGADNCPNISNSSQLDFDVDFLGDACDSDDDGDGVIDSVDCAVLNASLSIVRTVYNDGDADGFGSGSAISTCVGRVIEAPFSANGVDNCPVVSNPDQSDFDRDSQGDACDLNDDNDPFDDVLDCAERDDQRWRLVDGFLDVDEDGVGFGLIDSICSGVALPNGFATIGNDNCQFDVNPNQLNTDQDQFGNICDDDDDNDGILDTSDNCPIVINPSQEDEDEDGIGDACMVEIVNDSLCLPIKTKAGSVTVICL